jgi:hypothetical protein
MPAEPDNKMDDLLKSYARKRRDEAGAPLEVHPATRRLLHGEIARLRSGAWQKPRRWFSSLRVYWPQLTAAAAVLLVCGVGFRVWIQEQELPAGSHSYAMQQSQEGDSESLDQLNRPARVAESPATGDLGQDRKNEVLRSLGELQTTPAIVGSESAAARSGTETRKDGTGTSGSREMPREVEQKVVTLADEKPIRLTRNEPVTKLDALPGSSVLAPHVAPPPAQEPITMSRQLSLSNPDVQRGPAVHAPTDAFSVALADKGDATKPATRLTLTNLSVRSDSLFESPLTGGGLTTPGFAGREISTGLSGPEATGVELALVKKEIPLGGAKLSAVPLAPAAAQSAPGTLRSQTYYRLAPVNERRALLVNQTPRYRQSASPTGNSSGLSNGAFAGVLASFEMQQDGMQLRAIDSDGSIYQGQIGESSNVTSGKGVETDMPSLRPSDATTRSIQTGVRFRIIGTNQTLGQLVIFEGVVPQEPAAGTTFGRTATADSVSDVTAQGVSNSRFAEPANMLLPQPLQGTLRVGKSNAAPVRFVPLNR